VGQVLEHDVGTIVYLEPPVLFLSDALDVLVGMARATLLERPATVLVFSALVSVGPT